MTEHGSLCRKPIKFHNNTSSMKNHINAYHKKAYEEEKGKLEAERRKSVRSSSPPDERGADRKADDLLMK